MRRARSTTRWLAAALLTFGGPLLPPRPAGAEVEHQYAPLREAKLDFKDFSFPTLEGATLNLREQARGSRLVLVTYFAAWCHNSNYDAATINDLYAKYRERGLAVVGVCEYSDRDELRKFVEQHQPAYPICLEGGSEAKGRTATAHYRYRRQAGDKRKWGTPFNVFVRAAEFEARGETLAKRVRVAAGELVKSEAEEFIRLALGVGASPQ